MADWLDKRGRKRVTYRYTAKLEVSGFEPMLVGIHDISMSGVFLKTEQTLPSGTRGRLTIILQCGEETQKIHAQFVVQREVVRATEEQPRGMAVKLEGLNSDSSIHLFNIIKYQSGNIEC